MTTGAPTQMRATVLLEMIKFSHTVFALPFALVGALLAANKIDGGASFYSLAPREQLIPFGEEFPAISHRLVRARDRGGGEPPPRCRD